MLDLGYTERQLYTEFRAVTLRRLSKLAALRERMRQIKMNEKFGGG